MSAAQALLAEIEDPLQAAGWRVSRPDDEGMLHADVLRELCDRALPLHVGGIGRRGVAATLSVVDELQQQLVLACHADGIAIARALQARPLWAAALLQGLRVQFALAAACAVREGSGTAAEAARRGERFLIRTRWPGEIYRTSRRRAARLRPARAEPSRSPVARLTHGSVLVSARNLPVLDISELGCALRLPGGMLPPAQGTLLPCVEVDLDDEHGFVTDVVVSHVAPLGRAGHRVGCQWQGLGGAAQLMLRRWLAEAAQPAPAVA
ncbi:MAG: flagellar brake protein [Rubrivivax sp.]|nr:flagellar brake protein [Rubrivivax sp.]